jgi:hypothetical protein
VAGFDSDHFKGEWNWLFASGQGPDVVFIDF